MNKANTDIRISAATKGIKMWQIAEAIGVSEGKFCRMMRTEMPQKTKTDILSVIEKISNGEPIPTAQSFKDAKPNQEPEEEYKVIASRIKSLLDQTGMTQTELGKQTGILPNTISCFISGSRIPNAIHIIKIADAFNVSADYVLGRSGISQNDIDSKKIQSKLDKIVRCINEVLSDETP